MSTTTTAAKKAASKKPAAATAKKTASKTPAAATAKKTASKTPAAATAKKTASKKPAAGLSEQDLLARTLLAITSVPGSTWRGAEAARVTDEVTAAMTVCVSAGRLELARTIAAAIPAPQSGRALVSLALAGHADPNDATDAMLAALADPGAANDAALPLSAACHLAAFALDTRRRFSRALRRADALVDAARAVVDACFAAESLDKLGPVVTAYLELGERGLVASMIERVGAVELPESLAAGVWALEEPAKILPRIAHGNADVALRSPWVDLERWSLDQVSALADRANGTWARPALAEKLMALGRTEHARTLVIDDPAWDRLYLTWKAQRYLLVGDSEAATALLREADPPAVEFLVWAKLQTRLGVRDFDALWPLAAKRGRQDSVMKPIETLILLIHAELDAGAAPSGFGPALAAIDALFADRFRTQYDSGVEGMRRNQYASLRARLDIASCREAAAQAQVDADLAGVASLLGFAKDAYGRTGLLKGLVARAATVGRADVALKAALKIPGSYRSESAAPVAHAFLPGDPAGALKALERLATDPARRLLDGKGLLAALWTAVLPEAAEATPAS